MKAFKLIAGAALLTVAADAQAIDVCVTFDSFCDGLQLNISGDAINGEWVNNDCAGARSPVHGRKKNGEGQVFCTDDALCPFGPDMDFAFFLNPQALVFDLFGRDNAGNLTQFQAGAGFQYYQGSCAFNQSEASISTVGIQAPGL